MITRTRRLKKLNAITAGIATRRPIAVALSASAMVDSVSFSASADFTARCWNALITPSTVPNRPTNGTLLPSVPSTIRLRSAARRQRARSECIASAVASGPCARTDRPRSPTWIGTPGPVADLAATRSASWRSNAPRALGDRPHRPERPAVELVAGQDRVLALGGGAAVGRPPHAVAEHRPGDDQLTGEQARAVGVRIVAGKQPGSDLVQHVARDRA